MNKKEVLEIRKQYTHEKCSITRICGCYVDGEKNIKTQLKEAFLSLPEEETFKYFNLFKQTLSGTLGKNLLNLESVSYTHLDVYKRQSSYFTESKRIYPAAGCRFTGIEEQKHTWFLGGWEIRAGRLYAAQALSDL